MSPKRGAHSSFKFARVSRIDGDLHGLKAGRFQNVVFALHGAHSLQNVQEFHGLRASGFQNVALALAPRTFVSSICKSFTD
eukprot:3368658-Pyramimonas_sp.AAC.1